MSLFNQLVSRTIMYVPGPVVGVFARKYIAGEALEDAIRVSRELNAQSVMSTIDVLGEFISSKQEAVEAKNKGLEVLDTISRTGLNANLSIKPTQMGLKLDREFAYQNVLELVSRADELDNFIRIDMEDITCTDDTLDLYARLRRDYPDRVGTVLQSYLRRTLADIEALADGPLNIRLCKGIYREPREHAYKHPQVVNSNFVHALQRLFELGAYAGIATHDSRLVYEAERLIARFGLQKNDYEFQMLLGVDEQMRSILVAQGHRLRVYVPFGRSWLPYAKRRLKENPDIAKSALKQMFGMT